MLYHILDYNQNLNLKDCLEIDYLIQAELRRQEDEAKKLRLQGQNPDGGPEGDFMSEAKDWAGELISGQTGTGRILVSQIQHTLAQ